MVVFRICSSASWISILLATRLDTQSRVDLSTQLSLQASRLDSARFNQSDTRPSDWLHFSSAVNGESFLENATWIVANRLVLHTLHGDKTDYGTTIVLLSCVVVGALSWLAICIFCPPFSQAPPDSSDSSSSLDTWRKTITALSSGWIPSADKAATEIIVTFQPGRIGISYDGNLIKKVHEGGQAQQQGIMVGWSISEAQGQKCNSFDDQIFQDAQNGKTPYQVTFVKAEAPRGWQTTRKKYFPDALLAAKDVETMYSKSWMDLRQKVSEGVAIWSADRALLCADAGDEHVFNKKVELLKEKSCVGVNEAVAKLNTLEGHVACPEGYCVVFSQRIGSYFFLCRSDKDAALSRLPEVPAVIKAETIDEMKKVAKLSDAITREVRYVKCHAFLDKLFCRRPRLTNK
jgi:hypothetical protein|mmetsp:Transcript_121718/g.190989  ORF Transcript_121718/g.190989 Transcript_121718/m.190989 type:complete len:404 (+) Transcript_121718:38-1249(+)